MRSTFLSPLHTQFHETGYDMESFEEMAQYMDLVTKTITTQANSFTLGHCLRMEDKSIGFVPCCYQSKETYAGFSWNFRRIKLKLPSLSKKTFEALYHTVSSERLLLQKNDESVNTCDHVLISSFALESLKDKISKEEYLLLERTRNFDKSMALQMLFFNRDEEYTFILREAGKLQNVMGIMADSFVRMKLTFIYELIKKANGQIRFWDICQDISHIYFTMPYADDFDIIQPGFLIQYSDINACPITISIVWRLKDEAEPFYFCQSKYVIQDNKKLDRELSVLKHKEKELLMYKRLITPIKEGFAEIQKFYDTWCKLCNISWDDRITDMCLSELQNDIGIRNYKRIKQQLDVDNMEELLITILRVYTDLNVSLPENYMFSSDILCRILKHIKKL